MIRSAPYSLNPRRKNNQPLNLKPPFRLLGTPISGLEAGSLLYKPDNGWFGVYLQLPKPILCPGTLQTLYSGVQYKNLQTGWLW